MGSVMYSHTRERIAHTASSSVCWTVNMVIGRDGTERLSCCNWLSPSASGRSKCMQIMSA